MNVMLLTQTSACHAAIMVRIPFRSIFVLFFFSNVTDHLLLHYYNDYMYQLDQLRIYFADIRCHGMGRFGWGTWQRMLTH